MRYNHITATKKINPVATFAFDNTITQCKWDIQIGEWVMSLDPNKYIISEIYRLAIAGWKIGIVSSRENNVANRAFIESYYRRYDLPIDTICCTSSEKRAKFVSDLNSVLHYDHDWSELVEIIEQYPDIVCVRVPHIREDKYKEFS